MPIRPIDMQVAIPKLTEVSRMSHLEQQKAGLQQSQTEVTDQKTQQQKNKTVGQAHKDEKAGGDGDARKEGRNKYHKNQSKGHGKEEKKHEPESQHKIDIRI